MKRRDLLSVRTGKVLGSVSEDGTMTGWASEVLGGLRRAHPHWSDAQVAAAVLRDGWANQALYFGEVIEDDHAGRAT